MRAKAILTVIMAVAILAATGCAASRGEGITIGPINTGASQGMRDEIAQGRTQAEIAKVEAETAMKQARTRAGIEQGALTGEVWRKVLLAVGIAAAVAAVLVGVGFGGKLAAPLVREAVGGLEAALELRRSKRLEISLEVGPNGYAGHMLAEGYTQAEITDLVHQTPVLDAPRVQQLQIQAGPRGMQILADRGEVEEALARLPDPELTETEVNHD